MAYPDGKIIHKARARAETVRTKKAALVTQINGRIGKIRQQMGKNYLKKIKTRVRNDAFKGLRRRLKQEEFV